MSGLDAPLLPTAILASPPVRTGPDPLARLATHSGVDALYEQGHLAAAARDEAHEAIFGPRDWLPWIDRTLLALGVTLVVSAIVFFFAYNWSDLPGWAKLALAQTLVWGFAVAAWNYNIERLLGQMLLTAAAMTVGVLIAVFGQVYQTGADAWTGFALWAVLILPWAIVGRFQPLWLLWTVLANVALMTWWAQTIEPRGWAGQPQPEWQNPAWLLAGMTALNGGLLALGEWGAAQGWEFLQPRWPRWIVALWIACFTTFPVLAYVVQLFEPFATRHFGLHTPGGMVNVILYLALVVGGFFFARYRARDITLLGLIHLSVLSVVLTFVFCVTFLTHRWMDGPFWAPHFMFFGFCVFAGFGGVAVLLRHFGREMAAESEPVLPVAAVVAEPSEDDALTAALSSTAIPHLAVLAAQPAERPPVTWYRLLALLAGEGQASEPFRAAAAERAGFEARGGDDPWYYHLLVGFGAWVAACFLFPWFSCFIAPFGPDAAPYSAMLFGAAFITAGILLRRTATGTFSEQFALITSVLGHVLVIGGLGFAIGLHWHEGGLEVFTFLSAALLATTYFLTNDFIHRGLNALAVLSLITTWVAVRLAWESESLRYVLHALVAAEAAALVAVALIRWHPPLARPAWYALAIHLAGLVGLLAFMPHMPSQVQPGSDAIAVWTLSVALAALGIGLIVQHSTRDQLEPIGFCVAACLLLALAGTPELFGGMQQHTWQFLSSASISGLILAVLFIVIGKGRGDIFLRAMGVAMLPPLVILYYYSLEFSLLIKACVLLASGGVLLGVRGLVLERAKSWETAK